MPGEYNAMRGCESDKRSYLCPGGPARAYCDRIARADLVVEQVGDDRPSVNVRVPSGKMRATDGAVK